MVEKKATLIMELRDMASSGLKKVGEGLEDIKNKYMHYKAAAQDVLKVVAHFVGAYTEQEDAVNRLNVALKNQGIFTEALSKDLQDFATKIQNTTTFSDELTMEMLALLTTFGLTGDKLKNTFVAAMDLSVARGIDLNSVIVLLGKAYNGQTESLRRYGITVDETTPKNQVFNEILKQLSVHAGSAGEGLKTTSGQMAHFRNQVNELEAKIGGLLIPTISKLINALLTLLDWVNEIANSAATLQRFAASVGQIFLELGQIFVEAILNSFGFMSPLLEKIGIDLDAFKVKMDEMVNDQSAKLAQWASAAEATAIRQQQANNKTTSVIAGNLKKQVQDQEFTQKELDKILKAKQKGEDEAFKAWDKTSQEMNDKEKARLAERKANFESTLNFITSLASAKNKQLAAIGKAAALSQAYIDTFGAANRALNSAPPPFNYALMAGVIAAGLANVARISGVQLAEGGVVMPRSGGTLATLGEAGQAEAVIPLNDRRAQEAMGGIGGSVTIHVGTMIADDRGVKDLAMRIDEALFELQRTGQRVSN